MKKVIDARGLSLEVGQEVYTPREDSFLIIDLLKELNFNSDYFCEIGPGSGIVGLSLANLETTILTIDINHEATLQTAENARKNLFHNVLAITSESIRPFRKGAIPSIIIFNPPYLPANPEIDPYSPQYEVQQLVGGEVGDEVISSVLNKIETCNSIVFTIISSLATNPVEFSKKHQNWNLNILGSKNLGFETIWILKMVRQ